MKAILFIFLMNITVQFANAQKDNRDLEQGNKLYKEQQFDKAAEAYEKVLVKAPKNSVANYNLGNTLYRKNNAAEAEKMFDATIDNSDDKKIGLGEVYNIITYETTFYKNGGAVEVLSPAFGKSMKMEARPILHKGLSAFRVLWGRSGSYNLQNLLLCLSQQSRL